MKAPVPVAVSAVIDVESAQITTAWDMTDKPQGFAVLERDVTFIGASAEQVAQAFERWAAQVRAKAKEMANV